MQRQIHSLRARVAAYFERVDSQDPKNHYYRCQIEDCGRIISGKQLSNLNVHAKSAHETFYENKIKIRCTDPTLLLCKRLEFIQDCAEMIALDGCPFSVLAKSGFKNLIADKVTLLVENGYGEGLAAPNYPAVREYIARQATHIEETIKNEVKGKYVALMVDTATKNSKSFLGLSLKYVLNSKTVIRSLGIIEIHSEHSAINLQNEIMERLRCHGIEQHQIIGICTDNAKNMIATVKRFNASIIDEKIDDEGNVENLDEFDYDSEEYMAESEDDSDPVLDCLLDDGQEYADLLANHLSAYAKKTMNIYGIRCAAHTLQLAIAEAMGASIHGHLITTFRDVAKYLRKPSSLIIMKRHGFEPGKPSLDCETRWSSLYKMVCKYKNTSNLTFIDIFCSIYLCRQLESLRKRKAAIEFFAKNDKKAPDCLKEMLDNWNVFMEVLNVFRIPYEATNALQDPSMTLSDFFACWLKIHFKLERLNKSQQLKTDFASLLIQKLQLRKSDLLDNMPMMMAVYLDPRVRFNLSPDEIFLAKMNLEKLNTTIAATKCVENQETEDSFHNQSNRSDGENSFEMFMAAKAAEQSTTPNINNTQADKPIIDFYYLLTEYEKSSPFHNINVGVLEFWESKKYEFPVLYELATIVNSIPPTQTTVERYFSLLNFLFSARRFNLGAKILQQIMTIKTNEILAKKFNEIEKERTKNGDHDDLI